MSDITVLFGLDMETDVGSWGIEYTGVTDGTPKLLKLYEEKGITGTFYFTGETARLHPQVVQACKQAGHEVGCHSRYHETVVDPIFDIPGVMPLLVEDQFLAYAAASREVRPDFNLLRPGGEADLKELQAVLLKRVVDGDTFIVEINGQNKRLRLIGIDAPESFSHHNENLRTVEGKNVSRIVSALIEPGTTVWLQFDAEKYDQYDRILAYVYLDEKTMLNELFARFGLVKVKSYPPNTHFHDYLKELEAAAKAVWLGIWRSDSGFN